MQTGQRPIGFFGKLRVAALGSDLSLGRRLVWLFFLVILVGLSAFFWWGAVPLVVQRYLLRSTRTLVALGPPLAFGYSRSSLAWEMALLGTAGSCLVAWTFAKGVRAKSAIAGACWGVGFLLLWFAIGLFAASPSV